MSRVWHHSSRRLAIVVGALSLLTAPSLIPLHLAAQQAALAAESDGKPAANKPGHLPGRIYVWASLDVSSDVPLPNKYQGLISIDPNTEDWEKVARLGQTMRLSPDGSRVAFTEFKPREERNGIRGGAWEVFHAEMQSPQPVKLIENANLRTWSPDGQRLLYHVNDGTKGWHGTSWTVDLVTNEKQKLAVPETDQVEDWSSQGNWLVTLSDRDVAKEIGYQLYVMHPDGSAEHRVTQGKWGNLYPRFSPDSKQIAYVHEGRGENSLWIVGVDASNPRQIVDQKDKTAKISGVCWSPDGRWLAINVVENPNGLPRNRKARLEIVAVNGGGRHVLKLTNVTMIHLLQIPEWRLPERP